MNLRRYISQELTWIKLSYRFIWAHHPTCDPYANQRFDVMGVSLCQGCTLITVGAIISFIGSLLIGFSNLLAVVAMLGLTAVAVISIDGTASGRWLKRTVRLLMGIVLGISLAQLFLQPWMLKLGFAGLIFIGYNAYRIYRRMKPAKNLCESCDELKDAPNCSGMIDRMEANRKYRQMVLPVVDPAFIKQLERKAADNLE